MCFFRLPRDSPGIARSTDGVTGVTEDAGPALLKETARGFNGIEPAAVFCTRIPVNQAVFGIAVNPRSPGAPRKPAKGEREVPPMVFWGY